MRGTMIADGTVLMIVALVFMVWGDMGPGHRRLRLMR